MGHEWDKGGGKPSLQTLLSALRSSRARWVFTVVGEPKGQPRQRHFARKMGATFVARSYDPGTADGWKSLIATAARDAGLQGKMLDVPLRLSMHCHFSRPKGHFRTGKNAHLLRETAPARHTGKPDLDNVVKAAKDALTQCGVWRDDSLVCESLLSKRFAAPATPAFTQFEIEEVSYG